MIDILIDALIDSLKLIPLLFLSYLLISFLEKQGSLSKRLNYLFAYRLGPLFGALLGCLPQCGFSVIAASLYAQKAISVGTMVAVFISTSDEALPMFLSHPEKYKELGLLILIKSIIAIIAGYTIDLFVKHRQLDDDEVFEVEGISCSCEDSIFVNAIKRTLKTTLFILMINIIMGLIIGFLGEEKLREILMVQPFIQPFIAGLIGFIPNCASSILVVQLYFMDGINYGAMISGLVSGAGLGIAVLFRNNKHQLENGLIVFYIYLVAIISGMMINYFIY